MKTPAPKAAAAKRPARTTVRGVLNLAAALPDFGHADQKDIAAVSKGGGAGLVYGEGNTVPVIALAAAQASPTAYRCLERRGQLLEGLGFPTPARDPKTRRLLVEADANTLGELPLPGHPGHTANDCWNRFCSSGGSFNGVAVLVRYTLGKAIGEVHVLPFGSVRKTTAGTFLLNHKFGRKKYSAAETTEHLPFDPSDAAVTALLEKADEVVNEKTGAKRGQPGQIFYIYAPKAGEEDYPLPPHWAGLDAVLTEAAYVSYDLSAVRRGFRGKGILTMVGELDNTSKDKHGKTEQDYQDELLRRLTVAGAQEQGAELEDVLVLNAGTKEMAPVWTPMDTTMDFKALSEKKESVGKEICRAIGIPPVLLGFATPGQLGNNTELLNTYQLTLDNLEPLRRVLMRAFWQLFPALNGIMPGQRTPGLTTPTQPTTTPASGTANTNA